MKILIMSVNLRYNNEDITQADVRFQANYENMRLNGDITLSAEEYEGNESTASLTNIVKNRLEEGIDTWK